MALRHIVNDENFLNIVKNSKTIPEILRHYGLFFTGCNSTRLKNYLKINNIDISHIHTSSKGLTKETSVLVKKQQNTFRKNFNEGKIKSWSKGKTKDTDARLKKLGQIVSKSICDKVKNGTWHYSFSKVRTHEYQSKNNGIIKVMGSWELKYVKYLDENNINWIQNKNKFYYEFDGLMNKCGYYVPDFYLIDEEVYIEIKGYETDKDRAKWKWFPHKLKVLKRKELSSHPYNLCLSDKKTNLIPR
jgi:hypothetical protein